MFESNGNQILKKVLFQLLTVLGQNVPLLRVTAEHEVMGRKAHCILCLDFPSTVHLSHKCFTGCFITPPKRRCCLTDQVVMRYYICILLLVVSAQSLHVFQLTLLRP